MENMRREGYEFEVGPPKVITKRDEVTGERLEPMEEAVVEVPEEHVGQVRAGGGAGARGQGGGSWLVGARAREAGGKHTLTACCACCLRRTGGGPDGPAQGADDRHDRGWGAMMSAACAASVARQGPAGCHPAILPGQARPPRTSPHACPRSHPLSPPLNTGSEGTTRIKYEIPTRALLGLRNAMLTATKGTAVLNTNLIGWVPGGRSGGGREPSGPPFRGQEGAAMWACSRDQHTRAQC